jgi:GNAT superfamily N-acetyltransferase
MTSGVIVQPLSADDYAAWATLWDGYCSFYKATLAAEMTALTWSRLLDPMVPLHGWGAHLDGRLIGFAHALEHLSTWSPTPYIYLEDLFVEHNARAAGAGKALIEAVALFAKTKKSPKVYWQTAYNNEVARKLYDKVAQESGFLVYQRSTTG